MNRKIFSVAVFSLLVFSLEASAAEKAAQKPSLQVPKAARPVVIDGSLDEYPRPLITMDNASFEKLQYFEYGGKGDISADIYMLWDDANLYVAAKVTDDVGFDNSKEGPDIWDGDAVEVLLGMDTNADPGRIYFGKGDYQIGLSPGNNKDINPGEWVWRRDDYQNGIEVTSKPWDKGYILEAKIPFRVLGGIKPELNTRFDFDIAVDDSDKSKRGAQMAWTGTKEFFSDPSQWGTAVLGPPQAAQQLLAALAVSLTIVIIVLAGLAVVGIFVLKKRPNIDKIIGTEDNR